MKSGANLTTALEHVASTLELVMAEQNVKVITDGDIPESLSKGVCAWISNSGADHGFTDGAREIVDPKVIVLVFSNSLNESDRLYRIVHRTLRESSGRYSFEGDEEHVVQFSRIRPTEPEISKTPSNTKRHWLGGVYQATITCS
jgi:hypothetical protein